MFFFLISCFSFLLLSNTFLKPFPTWKSEMRMQPLLSFLGELSRSFLLPLKRSRIAINFFKIPTTRPSVNKPTTPKVENAGKEQDISISLLDLPDLVLECILERLSPAGLCNMAAVCSSLRDRCRSDHFWEKHMKQKWGRVIGDAAYRGWQWHIASRRRQPALDCKWQERFFGHLSSFWPNSWHRSKADSYREMRSSLPVDSIMAWYLSLESGKFCLPAQVYNREGTCNLKQKGESHLPFFKVQNGHAGFMLSCYDAELCYDLSTDTFLARYAAQGRPTVEENIDWNRIRAPAVDTPAHVLHISDCLHDLKPGDHVEIQWRRNKMFPYGWWYGVIGHSESCNSSTFHCQCQSSDTVVLEFKQYNLGSRWRQMLVNRIDHREVGDEANGFYGGIRKLYNEEEISIWKHLWPNQALE